MARFRVAGLRARVIILVVAAMLPALGLTFYSLVEVRSSAAVNVQSEAVRLVRIASTEQSLRVEATRELLAVLSQLPIVRAGESAACSTLLSQLLAAYPQYANLGTVDVDGSVLCSAIPVVQPVSAADRTWFREAVRTRQFAVGDFQIGRVTGKATVNFGYPVSGDDGALRGVIFAAWDIDELNRLFALAKLPPNAILTMMDRDGTILARYPQADTWKSTGWSDTAIVRAVHTGAEGTVEVIEPNGTPHLLAFNTLDATPEGDLHVSISVPTQVAFADVAQTFTRSLALLGLVSALTVVAGWLGGNLFIVRPVRALLGVTRQLRAGELSARTGPSYGVGELGQLARDFDEMAADLERSAAQLRLLLSKSLHIQDEERARIARDMHDGVLQLITAARYELKAAKLAVESGSPLTAEERFCDARQVLDEMEREIRQTIYDLHPSILDGRGLVPALRRYARGFRTVSGLRCEVRVKGTPLHLPSAMELGIYRMVEEALQNAAVHGLAQAASVTLDFRPTSLCVTVQDDGKGFDCEQVMAAQNADHLGLISIRERSESLGGKMDVRSQTGQGTTVTFWSTIPAGELATT
jgi:signal transduction histidine kinase